MKTRFLMLASLMFLGFACPESSFGNAPFRRMVDQAGRICLIPESPERVVSLAPSITEIVCALGRESCLKGVTRFSDFPESVKHLPRVGSYVRLDLEAIVALRPDVCIAVKDGNPKETVERLERLGIPVFAVDPRNLASVIAAVIDIGQLLNVTARAEKLAEELRKRIIHVKQYTECQGHRPSVFFQIGVDPIVSVGQDTFLHELIELSGADNLAGNDRGYPRYSMEHVLGLSPDIIIITSMARGGMFERVKAQWMSWPDLPAVRADKVYIVNSDVLDRPTPRMLDGLEQLTALIHPGFVPWSPDEGNQP